MNQGLQIYERLYLIGMDFGMYLLCIINLKDVIGKYLTEINVTSPTCIQEIKKLHKIDISKIIWDQLLKN